MTISEDKIYYYLAQNIRFKHKKIDCVRQNEIKISKNV